MKKMKEQKPAEQPEAENGMAAALMFMRGLAAGAANDAVRKGIAQQISQLLDGWESRKPCRRCGETATLSIKYFPPSDDENQGDDWCVGCTCGAGGGPFARSPAQAMSAWNSDAPTNPADWR